MRLLREKHWSPDIAVGVRDILGSGIWEGEYIVASKNIGPMDVSLGLGWGLSTPGGCLGLARLGTFPSGPRPGVGNS